MTISGFTMAKNAVKLYYPVQSAILSILPLVDEFVVALGDCDEDDHTKQVIQEINNPKIKIIDTVWDLNTFPNGTENAHQTDIAKSHCKGDWLFYLQADEVVHEKDLPTIRHQCEKYLNEPKVEGMLFDYYHFWGDYWHYHDSHAWYKNEIRIIRNDPDIHSWRSAQSFRRIPNFDGYHYRQKKGTYKLKVVKANAHIYHYGWVRPPHLMQQKNKALKTIHQGPQKAKMKHGEETGEFNYGNLNKLKQFKGSHPKVMQEWIQHFNWQNQLSYIKTPLNRALFKHEKKSYQILSFVENLLGITIGGSKNYKKIRKFL